MKARNLLLVDAVGTLDECRFTYKGMPVSKEIAKIYYCNTDCYKDVELAKKQDRLNWRTKVRSNPPPLLKELAESILFIYKAFTNQLTEREWFFTPALAEVLERVFSKRENL
jgi:phosphoribosylaminoimidazole-succinocarboxamide synthase